MRVLAVMPGITPDAGAEQSFVATAPLLVEWGVDLHLLLLTERQTLVPQLERIGVCIHDRSSERTVWARAHAIREVVRAVMPDLVHAVLLDATLPTQIAMIGVDTPLVVTWAATHQLAKGAEMEAGASRWKLEILRLFEVILGRATRSRYHAVTAGTADVCRKVVAAPAGMVMVAERGRPSAPFVDPPAGAVSDLRESLGVGADEHLVIGIGRQEPQKGFDTLIAVAEQLAQQRHDIVVAVAGRVGRATPQLESQVRSLPHGVRVRFLGHRDDIPLLLHAADVVVCTSRREGAAGAVIEAMAAARPIIVVPLIGTRGVVTDGLNGLVVPKERFADELSRLLDDPERRRRLGSAARVEFESRFTVERAARSMLHVYEWASGQSSLTDAHPEGATPDAVVTHGQVVAPTRGQSVD